MTTQYNIVSYGTLTNTNGVLSDFSASNYATIPLTFNPVQHPYEIVFKVNTETMPTNANGIIWQTGDVLTSRGRLDLEVWEDKLYAELAANEDIVWNIDGVTTLSSDTDYWIKLTYNGVDTYGLYISTDSTTWTTEGTTTSNGFLGDGTAEYNLIGVNLDEGGMTVPWFGSIDLNESYIKVNDINWWVGATTLSNVQTVIQLRHDTASNWTTTNPVLAVGEVGIETDTKKQKFGDGTTAWNSLAYSNGDNKQDALVSGTNIKTINNTSLLGSGNIDTSEIFIANGTTTYNEISNALLNGKTVLYNSGNIYYQYTYSAGTEHQFASLITLYSGDIRVEYATVNTSNTWNITTYTVANTDLSNLSTTGKEVLDGQWVSSSQGIITSATSLIGSTNLTYTVQVPNDGHVYEILLKGEVKTGTASGNFGTLSVKSNELTSDWAYITGALTRTSNYNVGYGTIIIPITRANDNLTVRRSTNVNCEVTSLQMLAYRRLGTNS